MITQNINLAYLNGSSSVDSTNVRISIPFPVKSILIKNALVFDYDAINTQGLNMITSNSFGGARNKLNLVLPNMSVGCLKLDDSWDYPDYGACIPVNYLLKNDDVEIDINETYDFNYRTFTNGIVSNIGSIYIRIVLQVEYYNWVI